MDFEPTPYNVPLGFLYWLISAGFVSILLLLTTLLVLLITRGTRGFGAFLDLLSSAAVDIVQISPRRVGAITRLTFLEAIRRRALLVFVVFAVLFMFAGWFLSGGTLVPDFQVKLYVSFVLRAIAWLVLPVALLLSCWGIPEDIKQRSLHTVVTKPVRRLEVVLGRMLGFGLINTLVLLVMAVAGYVWLQQQIDDEARAELTCRRPVFGQLTFLDREGKPAARGINVGDLWEYRSYIEGATRARAIWTFSGVDESALNENGELILENRFSAFRSHKGQMGRSLLYQLVFVNPESGLRVGTQLRQVAEFRGRTDAIPRTLPKAGEAIGGKITEESGETVDLIKDLVSPRGELIVEAVCIDPGQYMGMARPDLFIRTPDGSFLEGYAKCILGLEMMVLLVVFLGVAASTFLKGPVATLLTFCLVIVGMTAREFMMTVVSGGFVGGGPIESIYRIILHMNPSQELPTGIAFQSMQLMDWAMRQFVWLIFQIIPNFDYFNMAPYLANGFDVSFDASVLPSMAVTLGFFLPCLLLGYFCLRIRELEAK